MVEVEQLAYDTCHWRLTHPSWIVASVGSAVHVGSVVLVGSVVHVGSVHLEQQGLCSVAWLVEPLGQ